MSNKTYTKPELFVNDNHTVSRDVFKHEELNIPVEQLHNIKSELKDDFDDTDSALKSECYSGQQYDVVNLHDEPCMLGEQLHNVETKPEYDDFAMNLNSYQIKPKVVGIKKESLSPELDASNFKTESENETDNQDMASIIVEDPLEVVNSNYQIKLTDVALKNECLGYEEDANQDSMQVIMLKEPISSGKNYHFCNENDVDCKSSFKLTGHQETYFNMKTSICIKPADQTNDHTEQTDIHENPHICDVCNKSFSHSNGLKKHKRIHTIEKPFHCDVCNKSFVQLIGLKNHKLIHLDARPYVCDVCNKGFNLNSYLIKHKRIHTGEKPYSCDICFKSFNQSNNLTTHKLTHIVNNELYFCDVCHRSFGKLVNLEKHKRIHTNEKPYVCDMCDKSFNHSSDLIKHKKTHNGEKSYICDVCNKSFMHSSYLIKHKRIHTGEKPYACLVCNKSFSTGSDLIKHKRIHTGEKPYVCDVCNKSFNQSNNLASHKQVHRNEKKTPTFCMLQDL